MSGSHGPRPGVLAGGYLYLWESTRSTNGRPGQRPAGERIDELAGPNKGQQPILSTTGTQVAIAELIARNDRLERLVSELSLEIEALAASQRGDAQRMSRLRRTAR